MNKIILSIAILILFFACKENLVNNAQLKSITFHSFPFYQGNWWKYQFIDSLTNPITIDTVILLATSSSYRIGFEQYHFSWRKNDTILDSAEIYLSDFQLIYNDIGGISPHSFLNDFVLKLPFLTHDKWRCDFTLDSVYVSDYKTNVVVLNKTYSLYDLKIKSFGMGGSRIINMQIADSIGIVSQQTSISYTNVFPVRTSLYLIDYQH